MGLKCHIREHQSKKHCICRISYIKTTKKTKSIVNRPFQCEICNKFHKNKGNMYEKMHEQIEKLHQKESTLFCSFCPSISKCKDGLLLHIKDNHPKDKKLQQKKSICLKENKKQFQNQNLIETIE